VPPISHARQRDSPEGFPATSANIDFVVLIRHEGYACRLWVASIENARRVLDSLSRSFVFRTSEPFKKVDRTTCFTFRVSHGSQLSPRKLESLLAAIPSVSLRIENSPEE
jgi:hypothetical protein